MIIKCSYCRNDFHVPLCRTKRSKNLCCSTECSHKYKRESGMYAGSNNPAFVGDKIERICHICNGKYSRRKSASPTHICSNKCRAIYYKVKFSGSGNPSYKKDREGMMRIRRAKSKANKHKRRALGYISHKIILDIYDKQNGVCFYCKIPVNNSYHLDHYIPVSKGGTNAKDNLVVACRFCNLSKKDKLPQDFSVKNIKLIDYKIL